MYRVLLDQGLPLGAAKLLRDQGVDAVHVEEAGLARGSDPDILRWARTQDRACFTLDHDFHRLLAETKAVAPSVVLLRFQFLRANSAARLIAGVLEKLDPYLAQGIAATVTSRGIRRRSLPLKGSAEAPTVV